MATKRASVKGRWARVPGAEKPTTLAQLWGATGLLALYAVLRLYALLRFPPFGDEMWHLHQSAQVRHGHIFIDAASGRVYGLAWLAPATWGENGQLFAARALTTLFALLGGALLFRLVRSFAGTREAALALLIFAWSPYTIFYDRLVLVDIYATVPGVAATWFAVRYARRGRSADAALCGGMLWLAFAGKASGMMLFPVPLAAYALLGRVRPRRAYVRRVARGLALSWGIFGVLSALFLLALRWRGYNYFGTATTLVGAKTLNGLSDYFGLWRTLLGEIDRLYFGAPLLLVWAAAWLLYLRAKPRQALFWVSVTFIPVGGMLLFGRKMSARYFLFHVPLLIAGGTVALMESARALRRYGAWIPRIVPVGVALTWVVAFALPFYAQYLRDPAALHLPPLDRLEYVTSDAAGFGLAEVGEALSVRAAETERDILALGLLPNCDGLAHEVRLSEHVVIVCPRLPMSEADYAALDAQAEAAQTQGREVWAVYERNTPFFSLEAVGGTWAFEEEIARPDNVTALRLYRLEERCAAC